METQITEYSTTAAALAELRQKYAKAVFDTSTPAGMAKAVAARRELREVRVNLEKLRKELKQPALERSRLIDAEAKTLTVQIEEMEKPIDDQIKAEEQRKAEEKAERERVEREKIEELQRRVADIRSIAVLCAGKTSEIIEQHLEALKGFDIGPEFGLLQHEAYAAKGETLITLVEMWERALTQEAEAERLRIEREELEAQRKAQEEQAAKDRAELAKLRAEAEARQRAADERARIEREAIEAERRKQEAEAAVLRAAEDAKRAEEERAAAAIRAAEEAKSKAIRDAEEAELARQRAEIEEQRRAIEEAARKVQSGYEALQSFVDRFGAEKEFSTIAKQISKWLASKNQEAA